MLPLIYHPEYPTVLVELATLLHQRLAAQLPAADAARLARDLAEDVRRQWGGGLIYIPQGARYARRQRDADIWRECNGHNHAALARRYGLSLSCIYRTLARENARRQGRLFGDAE